MTGYSRDTFPHWITISGGKARPSLRPGSVGIPRPVDDGSPHVTATG